MAPPLTHQAGPINAVLEPDLAPSARTPDRVVRARWEPVNGESGDSELLVRDDLIEGFVVRYGGTTPKKTVDELADRVYARYEARLRQSTPDFDTRYRRADYLVLNPTEAGTGVTAPTQSSGSRYAANKMVKKAA